MFFNANQLASAHAIPTGEVISGSILLIDSLCLQTSMPMNVSKPTCINADGSTTHDCCDLRWNEWTCPIPVWMRTGGGGPTGCECTRYTFSRHVYS